MRLDDAMVKSLIQNRTEFVKLFLDNATDMEEFLDINNLWNIYANVSMTNMFFSHWFCHKRKCVIVHVCVKY